MENELSEKKAQPGDLVLVRDCWIEGRGGEINPLTLSFFRPTHDEDGTFTAALRMSCAYFDKEKKVHGVDELQAFSLLLTIGLVLLQSLEGQGYSIWHLRRGDLHYFDFWSGRQFQQEFSLPSAYTEVRRAAFHEANAGKQLMPSHRVGIEPDRPAITIYKIREDGTDRPGLVIGAEEMKGHTWESLAQLVGERILWDSREGIELMVALQPDRRPDPDD
ncbi:MAG: hypothetical protein WDN45_08230 [Caulobacteraceae bacterium]